MVNPSPPGDQPLPGATAQALAAAANSLACPLLLLGLDGSLVYANPAGLNLLQQGLWLQLETRADHPRVTARGALATRRLQQALAAAAAGARQHLRLPPELHPARAVISALPRAPGRKSDAAEAPVLLLMASVGAGEPGAPLDLGAYAEHHGLTGAEIRVLVRLARGDSASAAAAALGLGVSTVRTQIGSLRRKTGHASQAALVLTLAALPPLRAPAAAIGG